MPNIEPNQPSFDWSAKFQALEQNLLKFFGLDAAPAQGLDKLMASPSPLDRFGTQTGSTYSVKHGDTLSAIAAANGTDVKTLARINGLTNPDLIRPGQQLRLPAHAHPASHTVRAGETLSGIAARTGTSVAALARANHIANPNRIFPGQVLAIPGRNAGAQPAPAAPARPVTPTPGATPIRPTDGTTATGQINLRSFFDPANASNSPAAIVIGNAEGTRTPSGGTTRAYAGHTDPGNGAANRGSFSLQGAASRTPEQADRIQLARLSERIPTFEAAARRAGLDPTNAKLATAYFDLYNQSPMAAARFLNQLDYAKQNGISTASMSELRFRSFVDVNTGARFPGAGGGFAKIAADNLGRRPSEAEVQNVIRADQTRRETAMARAMTTQGIGAGGPTPTTAPAGPRPSTTSGPVNTVLPAAGTGYVTYGRERGGADQVGTAGFIANLQAIGVDWAARGGRPIQIGDISRAGGGAFAPHSGHRRGNEADIRPFNTDGSNAPVRWDSANYDRATTRALVETIRARNPNAVILFNDPQLIREGLVQRYKGHDNHLHVRL